MNFTAWNDFPLCPSEARTCPVLSMLSNFRRGLVSENDVIENFDFQKLTRSNEITGNFDVHLGWSRMS